MPNISVVIPAYNAERYIDETLRCVRDQTLRDIEIIVVDDCSSDETAAEVAKHVQQDSRVKYLRTPSNSGGPASPRNIGVDAATSEWIAFCDADDLWHPLKLEFQWNCAQRAVADLVCTAVCDFDDGTSPGTELAPVLATEQVEISVPAMLRKNRIATSSVLCRRADVLRAGGFDADRQLIAVEDYDLWLRLMSEPRYKALRLASTLVYYRRLPGSLSKNKLLQARKVSRVLQRHFMRTGKYWQYPLAVPFLMTTYATMSLWQRVVRRRM